jgi:ABC-type multidrug transport system fused ATPase/permease subunit
MAALLVSVFSLLLVVPGLIVPGLSMLFVDRVMLQHFQNWVLPICGAMFAATVMQAAVTFLQQRYLVRIEAKLAVVMSSRVLTGMLAQPMAFFGQRFAGELAGRINAADNIAELLSGQVATTAFNMIAVLIYGVAMLMFDPLVAAVALSVPVINILIMRSLNRRMTDLNMRVAVDHGKLMGHTVSVLAGVETIKVAGAEGARQAFVGARLQHHPVEGGGARGRQHQDDPSGKARGAQLAAQGQGRFLAQVAVEQQQVVLRCGSGNRLDRGKWGCQPAGSHHFPRQGLAQGGGGRGQQQPSGGAHEVAAPDMR